MLTAGDVLRWIVRPLVLMIPLGWLQDRSRHPVSHPPTLNLSFWGVSPQSPWQGGLHPPCTRPPERVIGQEDTVRVPAGGRSWRVTPKAWGSRAVGFALLLMVGCAQQPLPPTPAPAEVALPPAVATAVPTALAPPVAPLGPEFSGAAAFQHVHQLADVIGIREAGTAKEVEGAGYIAGQLRGYGYEVSEPPVDFELAEESAASLEITGPSTKTLAGNSLGFSPSGDVTAPLVAVPGTGRPEDFPPSVKGAIALVQRGTLQFADKVKNAADAGAVAIIVYNNEPSEFRGTLGKVGQVAALGVSGDVGQELLKVAGDAGKPVHLVIAAQRRTVNSHNVLAKVGQADCHIVVGGHFDSVPAGPGANDNGSGTATMIELARVLRPDAERGGICFMAFGAEELGLWGSRTFVKGLSAAERGVLKAMVNLDMVGVGDRWRITGSDSLVKQVADIAGGMGIAAQAAATGASAGGGSDHASFLQAGIPAVFFYRMNDPNYHLATDQAQFVDPAALEQAGRMAAALVRQLVNGGS